MSRMDAAMYDALITAGAPEDKARAAAESVPEQSELVTKADLTAAIAELKEQLTIRMITLMLTVGGIAFKYLFDLIQAIN